MIGRGETEPSVGIHYSEVRKIDLQEIRKKKLFITTERPNVKSMEGICLFVHKWFGIS